MVRSPATAGLALVLAAAACGGASTGGGPTASTTSLAAGSGTVPGTPGPGEPPLAVRPGPRTTSNGTRPPGVAAPGGVELSADAGATTATGGAVISGTLTVENRGGGTLALPPPGCAVDAGLFFDGERVTAPPPCRGGHAETLPPGGSKVYPFEVRAAGPDGALQAGSYDLFAGLVEAGTAAWAPPVAVRITD